MATCSERSGPNRPCGLTTPSVEYITAELPLLRVAPPPRVQPSRESPSSSCTSTEVLQLISFSVDRRAHHAHSDQHTDEPSTEKPIYRSFQLSLATRA